MEVFVNYFLGCSMAFCWDYFLDYSLEVFGNYYFLGSFQVVVLFDNSLGNFCVEDYCLGSDTFL